MLGEGSGCGEAAEEQEEQPQAAPRQLPKPRGSRGGCGGLPPPPPEGEWCPRSGAPPRVGKLTSST